MSTSSEKSIQDVLYLQAKSSCSTGSFFDSMAHAIKFLSVLLALHHCDEILEIATQLENRFT